ncbi:hypothetical protein [Pseudomonas sp. UBA6562]|uniref:hypothetical protein n=1 Tax=Pseudomonas sp. UBA6562 TaxID=1947332 RepID=UPI0025FC019D|nr:hypothetical protein [Pseudomonas sp. UBA6562]
MWSEQGYLRLVRASGVYDLLVTLAFATPWTFVLLHGQLLALHQALGLAGEMPTFGPLHMLMANLMGSIVCVWAWLRIRHPQRRFGRYDAAGRVLFACWQGYALGQGATQLVWGVLVLEMVWAVLQWWPVKKNARAVAMA